MPDLRHAAVRYFRHWLLCESIHSAHSPFLYSFWNEVLCADVGIIPEAEQIRQELVRNQNLVPAFSSLSRAIKPRPVSHIVRNETASPALASFYSRLAGFTGARNILEIGTSVGLTSLYLSSDPARKLITMEAVEEISRIAIATFRKAGRNNIRLVMGDARLNLASTLQDGFIPDLALIDASHTFKATVEFFETLSASMNSAGVIIIDDIHHNHGMTQAWATITEMNASALCLDCFRFGMVFLDPSLPKECRIIETPFALLRS